ncbi:ParB/RepB/Spo0J family partition protein [Mastigocoleus testarum]|uniref:ParB/RepB/Spo0J family partition protein n=1 Tax=Mastigocoleus testarum TaxID=996925 RepID=UPI0003F4CA99|nr:ParB/RepB/Spo0J family partition protein [Mastigocoleus testarum]
MSKKNLAYNTKLKHVEPLDLMFGAEDSDFSEQNSVEQTNKIISAEQIKLDPNQSRRYFDPKKLEELSQSIKEVGILQPLVVRQLNDGYYELIAGERRFKAAEIAEISELPCVIKEIDENTLKKVRLIENLQREDLNAYEETIGILELLALQLKMTKTQVVSLLHRIEKANRQKADNVIRSKKNNQTDNLIPTENIELINSIFAYIGRLSPESFRVNRLPLLNLPQEIQEALASGKIEYTKARAIAKLKIEDERKQLLIEAIENNLSLNDIQQRVKDILAQNKGITTPSLKEEYKKLSKQLGYSKVWNNPKKKKTLEKLLNQIRTLLDQEQN